MKGHDSLIRMRMNGLKPEWVHLYDYPCDVKWEEFNMTPSVCVDGDPVTVLDLRFLINMKVAVHSPSEVRAKALFEACKKSKASFVIGCHIQADQPNWNQKGWVEIFNG
jgi:hypothetical protein